jgi:hypothetical protein
VQIVHCCVALSFRCGQGNACAGYVTYLVARGAHAHCSVALIFAVGSPMYARVAQQQHGRSTDADCFAALSFCCGQVVSYARGSS